MKIKSPGGIGGQGETNNEEEEKLCHDEAVATAVALQAEVTLPAPARPKIKSTRINEKDFVPGGQGIDEPGEFDVLNGRGASVNASKGNQRFRALCFQRKPYFEGGNHAAKRRIATEIVDATFAVEGRFLKKREKDGPWFELTKEKAILKACQVMRDFERPDRVGLREMARQNAKKRNRVKPPSTPMPDQPLPPMPEESASENPFGVHDHDVISGRGAFVNGHVGNTRFRKLALERKSQFEAGNYSEKRALATEIVGIIRSLEPPGRFLKRVNKTAEDTKDGEERIVPEGLDDSWEELTDDKAIHKACQVMRDIDRPDRGPDRRAAKKAAHEATTVAEVVAAAEAALDTVDTVMDGVTAVPPPQASTETQEETMEEEVKAVEGEEEEAPVVETSTEI